MREFSIPIIKRVIWIAIISIISLCNVCAAKIIYVDNNANGLNNGLSWENAYNYLQNALADADDSEKPVEIRIAQGIYKPDRGAGITPGDREASFQLINSVKLLGGYAGLGEPDPNARDIELYETILSGDLTGNDIEVNDPCDLSAEPTRSENSYHVVTGSSTDATAIIDGFHITAGNANGPSLESSYPDEYRLRNGAGMYIISGSPTLTKCNFIKNVSINSGGIYNYRGKPTLNECIFTANSARRGGGMHNDSFSRPTLNNCTFNGNLAHSGGGLYSYSSNPTLIKCTFNENTASYSGGGMLNNMSNPTLTDCKFDKNSAQAEGGGITNSDRSMPMLTNCIISENSAYWNGGGMHNSHSSPTLNNCTISENQAMRGGGMHNEYKSSQILYNCTFRNNYADYGGGISNRLSSPMLTNCVLCENSTSVSGGGMCNYQSNPKLMNCTLSGNSAQINGGAIDNNTNCNTILSNCTFHNNYADRGCALTCNPYPITLENDPSIVRLINCILWDGGNEISNDDDSTINIAYSDIRGGQANIYDPCETVIWSEGNIDVDPLFADPQNNDYHLKSQAGRWASTGSAEHDRDSEGWVTDETSSPCIDAGDPNEPIGLEPFPNGCIINMGVYGGTKQASMSPGDMSCIPDLGKAYKPVPVNGAIDVASGATLMWTPGKFAEEHDVYFGTSFYDVNTASPTTDPGCTYMGRLDANSLNPGWLDIDTTYYWRIDEINNEVVTTGDVWMFTTTKIQPPKGIACFTGETPVWVDGALIPISKVKTEQKIYCIESIGKIEEIQEHEGSFDCFDILLQSGRSISAAECHYFLTESGRWVSLQQLKAGIKLQTAKGSIEIISVTKRPTPYVGKVYNLKIEGTDRYLVGKDAVIVRDY